VQDSFTTIQLNIPTEVLYAARIRRGDIQREVLERLALSFYMDGSLSFGQAARLAGLDYWQFSDLLVQTKTPYGYDVEDLESDLRHASEIGLLECSE